MEGSSDDSLENDEQPPPTVQRQGLYPIVLLRNAIDLPYENDDVSADSDDTENMGSDSNTSEYNSDAEHEPYGSTSAVSNFDTNLPTEHAYLGNDLEYLRGRVMFEDYQIVDLPVLPGESIVCPGHTYPITYFHHRDLIQNIIHTNRTFGLTFTDETEQGSPLIGVTVEIYEYAENSEEIKLKAKGRQRFRIVDESLHDTLPIGIIRVQIMPEIALSPPLRDIQISSLNKCRVYVTDNNSFKQNHLLRTRDAAQTSWPLWVYNCYDEYFLMSEIINRLTNFREILPQNSVKLSYWVIQNFLLSTIERIQALRLNCVVQRLRLVLKFMRQPRVLSCAQCHEDFAGHQDLFPMSKDGLQNIYCNPGGIIHETITVLKAKNINLVGTPQTEYSWFPGYAWTIAQCRLCGRHIGWLFTAVKPNLEPHKFYGLTRTSFIIKIKFKTFKNKILKD